MLFVHFSNIFSFFDSFSVPGQTQGLNLIKKKNIEKKNTKMKKANMQIKLTAKITSSENLNIFLISTSYVWYDLWERSKKTNRDWSNYRILTQNARSYAKNRTKTKAMTKLILESCANITHTHTQWYTELQLYINNNHHRHHNQHHHPITIIHSNNTSNSSPTPPPPIFVLCIVFFYPCPLSTKKFVLIF